MSINRQRVESSNITEVDWENNNLTVFFLDGSIYRYKDVPETVFKEFLEAPSKGSFMHRNLGKGQYTYMRIDEEFLVGEKSEYVKKLEGYKDSTIGYWATDKPEIIPEELKKWFIELKF